MAVLSVYKYELYFNEDDSDIAWQTVSIGASPATETHTVNCSSGNVFIVAQASLAGSNDQKWKINVKDYSFATDSNEKSHYGTRYVGTTYDAGNHDAINYSNVGASGYELLGFTSRINSMVSADGHGTATIEVSRVAGTGGTLKIAAVSPKFGGL